MKQQTHVHPTATVCEECLMPAAKSPQTLIQNADGSATLRCVKCPFCQQIVNAHMTKTQISCPKCQASVQY